jgi:pyroglutamyl-peptidase
MSHTEEPRRVVVFITGYGPFGTVKVNPSAPIAKLVGEDLKRHPAVVAVHAEQELVVSIKAVGTYFDQLESEVEKTIAEHGNDVRILLCHLGVHPDTTGLIRAEVQGYNELHASLPDVDGVPLNHDPIIASDGPIEVTLESWFGKSGTPQLNDLESLIAQLNTDIESTADFKAASAKSHDTATETSKQGEMVMPSFQPPRWTISRDAGRYLCNCALYRALRLQEKHQGKVFGIFVHVVDPSKGKTEGENGEHIVAYNPTIMSQSEEVKKFVRGLLSMMTAS